MTRPTVSVVIPTYNRAATLPRAIDSIIRQTMSNWEIIIVDDGSTDGTAEILRSYASRLGDRLVCVRQENCGCSVARNRGIDLSRGHYVAFLDSDDEFLPSKAERQLDLLERYSDLSFVFSDYSYTDLSGRCEESALAAKFPRAYSATREAVGPNEYLLGPDLFDLLLQGYFIATIVGMVRRDVLTERMRFHAGLSYAEEWLFYLKLSLSGRVGFIDEPLAMHHFTANSLTRTDKSRNIRRQCALFQAMRDDLVGLTAPQRGIVQNHLANAHAQLAAHFRSSGHPAKAWAYSASSLFHRIRASRLLPTAVSADHQVSPCTAR